MIAATILAAGESSRMGSQKALLPYQGRTFLTTILEKLHVIGIHRCLAVNENSDVISNNLASSGVTIVTNQELEAGPIGSIRATIRALESQPLQGLLVWPVDLPHVSISTVEAVVKRFKEIDLPEIVVPSFESKRGHPVMFRNTVFSELLSCPNELGARAVVRADPKRVQHVVVTDAAIVDQINTPADYKALLARQGE